MFNLEKLGNAVLGTVLICCGLLIVTGTVALISMIINSF